MVKYGIKTVSCALRCARCKFYTGYDSRKGGVIHIDTRCAICKSRLRHTRLRQGWRWEQKHIAPAYGQGIGGHNKSRSVIDVRMCPPRKGKITAVNLNIEIMNSIAKRDGVNLDDVRGQFRSGRRPQ